MIGGRSLVTRGFACWRNDDSLWTMRSHYLIATFNHRDNAGWFVVRSRDGGMVASGLTKARAMTLVSTLNLAANVMMLPWRDARNQPGR